MLSKVSNLEIYGEERGPFSWVQALKVKVNASNGITFLTSQIVEVQAPEKHEVQETSFLISEVMDPYPTLSKNPRVIDMPEGSFSTIREIKHDNRLVGLEYLLGIQITLGCYSNLGSYYVNLSTDAVVCQQIREFFQIVR